MGLLRYAWPLDPVAGSAAKGASQVRPRTGPRDAQKMNHSCELLIPWAKERDHALNRGRKNGGLTRRASSTACSASHP